MPSNATSHTSSVKNGLPAPRTRSRSQTAARHDAGMTVDASSSATAQPSSSRSRAASSSKGVPTNDVNAISRRVANMRLADPTQSGRTSKIPKEARRTIATPPHPGATSVDDLASKIADHLHINSPHLETFKCKDKENMTDERAVATRSLQCLQKASQTLSDAVQLGWRATAPSKGFTKQALRAVVAEATTHIQVLRGSPFSRRIDVERTAIHMAGRLSSLELIDDSEGLLISARSPLAGLYTPSKSHGNDTSSSASREEAWWYLPTPKERSELNEITAATIGTFHLQCVQVLLQGCDDLTVERLLGGPNILTWYHWLSQSLPDQQCSALLTSTFQAVAKCKASLPPQLLFKLRSWSIQCLVRTTPLKEDAFWDQCGKYSVSYVKAAGSEAWPPVAMMLDELFDRASQRHDRGKFFQGRGFIGICEYRLKLARAAKNAADIRRIKLLLDRPAAPPIDTGATVTSSIEMTVAKLCACLAEPITIMEELSNDSLGDFGPLRLAVLSVEDCTRLCDQPDIPAPLREKVDQDLEHLRSLCTKFLGLNILCNDAHDTGSADDSDNSIVPSVNTADRASSFVAVSNLLEAVLNHFLSPASEATRPQCSVSCVQSYIVLAKASTSQPKGLPSQDSFSYLERAATAIRASGQLTVTEAGKPLLAECLRSIALAHWILGLVLYQNERIAAAVPYLTQSCQLGYEALSIAGKSELHAPKLIALTEQMPKRWELLGCCEARTGDSKAARAAYVRGLLAFQVSVVKLGQMENETTSLATMTSDPAFRGLFSLVERYTQLLTFDLLASEAVSLRHVFADLEDGDAEVSGVASLVEYQFQYLASSPASRSSAARAAMKCLIADAVVFYQVHRFPIRRARALLRQLEQMFFDDDQDTALQIADQIHAILCCQESSSCAFNMSSTLQSVSPTQDNNLVALCPAIIATTNLWLALIAHRRTSVDVVTSEFHLLLSRALQVLKNNYLGGPGDAGVEVISSARVVSKVAQKVLSDKQNQANSKKNSRASRKARAAPKENTPKAPKRRLSESTAQSFQTLCNDVPSLDTLIAMCARAAGMLGLDLLKLESLRIRLAMYQRNQSLRLSDEYVWLCINVAQEYLSLGRFDLAGSLYAEGLSTLERSGYAVSSETRIALYLAYATATAAGGNLEQSLAAYKEATILAEALSAEAHSGALKPIHRVRSIVRSATAANTFSTIQENRDDTASALEGLMQSLRLWNRASYMLERLNTPGTKSGPRGPLRSPNPFDVGEQPETVSVVPKRKTLFNLLQWCVAEGTATTLFDIARLYGDRGSPRESEYFLKQAIDFAGSVHAVGYADKGRIRLAELKIISGARNAADDLLSSMKTRLSEFPRADGVDYLRVCALMKEPSNNTEDVQTLYREAASALANLEQTFSGVHLHPTLNCLPEIEGMVINLLPTLAATVWRQQIWLLRDVAGDGSEYSDLLDKFLSLPTSRQTKAEENILMARLSMNEIYARFKGDIVLNSLPESTIAIPLGMHGGDVATPPTSTRELFAALTTAERFFWYYLESCNGRRRIADSREASVAIALIRAYEVVLGAKRKNAATVAASLLDWSSATTLREELVDCIGHKFLADISDDLAWRAMSITGSPVRAAHATGRRAVLRFTESDDDDDEDASGTPSISMKTYWYDVRERYRTETCDAVSLATSPVDVLPDHWTVVTISLTEDRSTLIVSRQRPRRDPVIVYLPVNRQDRRDEGGDDRFTWEMAIDELESIIQTNNETTRISRNIVEREGRIAWWSERVGLDQRLKSFVDNVEYCWLGVFKTILSQPLQLTQELRNSFRSRVEAALRRNGCIHEKRDKQRLHVDDSLLECFSSLSPKCRDEELEDLAYFVLDLFQLHGAQVAVSEIDIDQLTVDLRAALEEHCSAMTRARVQPVPDHHLFLVLDRNVQGIPWESIPILRGHSVSRVPSVSFLIDRVHLARYLRGMSPLPDTSEAASGKNCIDRTSIDPRRTFYVLNPSGDLKPTQKRFQPWLEGMRQAGWTGIIGRVPTEEELVRALTTSDLVIYFGHGGAEQYIRAHKVRNLPRCASIMLWGCSSGALKEMGHFDRVGTPYNYMVAGCPSLVATLWDVTDKDIDTLADSVFQKLRLDERTVRTWSPLQTAGGDRRLANRIALASPRKRAFTVAADGTTQDTPIGRLVRGNSVDDAKLPASIVGAVATSRDVCKLQYLTGAAVVVYGVPFYL